MRDAVCLLLGLFLSLPAWSMPEPLRRSMADLSVAGNPGAEWHQWGSGEMRWFGLPIYRATLWVAGRKQGPLPEGVPLALSLEYRRDIPAARIVSASVDEMKNMGASEAQLARWANDMRRLFPDVKEGDVLTGVMTPGLGARFFHRERDLGVIADPEFSRRFFAIWLDERTSRPDIRSALLRSAEE